MAAAAASCRTVLGFRTDCACCSCEKFPGPSQYYWRRLTAAPRAFDRCKNIGLSPELHFGRKVGGLLVEPLYIVAAPAQNAARVRARLGSLAKLPPKLTQSQKWGTQDTADTLSQTKHPFVNVIRTLLSSLARNSRPSRSLVSTVRSP